MWGTCTLRRASSCCGWVQELSLLQDRVPAFDPARAAAIIEQELGMPLASAYRSFEREPIAAASLGQVPHYDLFMCVLLHLCDMQ